MVQQPQLGRASRNAFLFMTSYTPFIFTSKVLGRAEKDVCDYCIRSTAHLDEELLVFAPPPAPAKVLAGDDNAGTCLFGMP